MSQRKLTLVASEFDEKAWKNSFYGKLAELEKKYGKGSTYALHVRDLILSGIVPEWLFRQALVHENPSIRERCEKACHYLEKLHEDALGPVKPEATLKGAQP